ncbi:hypothetical protein TREMEDRAFT_25385 [Tremella mesenterica DSM 1558]|uniref:uncharacterized protein n=1 Tax=Tremella mesenterica (strain ATCC 24925 / CBS 8224 / DSM 1558 / NBRC 9311 / NRRL Y-6157 / RJB 2259-6 / UBC 559-6) TaxID=578456 RepID=UPI0003F492AC|nr:uncharacterized protein TREMEDRAFT_25385 [Tremella mesenterica DSM 1558]EIW73284.1 hypothetical protein TREMEDRAFT_25385 [Tremella mesenterica DSM 1558]
MHILLTGVSGRIGPHVLTHLLSQGHTVTAIDKIPMTDSVVSNLPTSSNYNFYQIDLTQVRPLQTLLDEIDTLDGVVHLSGIPGPYDHDAREVHNNNVVGTYNVLYTVLSKGVKRVVQASSVNATGGVFTALERLKFPKLPYTEDSPCTPEDPYSLSKQISEIQASALTRLFPGSRISSLRLHMACTSYDTAKSLSIPTGLWGWVSYSSIARACLAAITEGEWEGHEVFNIVSPEICHEVGEQGGGQSIGSLDLMKIHWKDVEVDEDWWLDNPRKGFWDCSKAKRMLRWNHDE